MLKIYRDPEALFPALADFIVACANEAIRRDGKFNLVLSGGSSPKKLYELLASASYQYKIDWKKVFFFFGHERSVPSTHPDNNFLMARRALFDPLNIGADHVVAVDTSLPPTECAKAYERNIRGHFKGSCRFDLILLGLGENSHTASLFPHTTVLHETQALIKAVLVDGLSVQRITFTARLINLAHRVVFLVFGASKSEAVHHILEDPLNIDAYP
ncbi:MAG TPA: 6-phosphogluconolactonase, partial [Bacteroidota bacterium]|nr:6-phosphogluconolactonase [Bacteroidota bacterium]